MFKMKLTFAIIFITIELFQLIRCDETVQKIHSCDLVRCANVENCPIGTYLELANREKGECCNSCKPYAKLGEKCGIKTGTPFCIPNLVCSYENDSYNSTACAYAWENNFLPNIKCDPNYCPTYKSCPKNSFLIPNNASKYTCCEQCVPYSTYGDYCDSKQPCLHELKCKNNICIESDACANQTQSCQTITNCPNNTYFLQGDGLTRCCDVCLTYAGLHETCNEISICGPNLICDADTQTCKNIAFKCDLIQCSPPRCEDGYVLVYDRKISCCPYCDKPKN